MTNAIIRAMTELATPLEPKSVTIEERLDSVPVAAVLFDIYGTLVISASGDVGTADDSGRAGALVQALDAVGLVVAGEPEQHVQRFLATIARHHAAARESGVDYPEVEIREVWREVLAELGHADVAPERIELLAVNYEARANPTWPMPGLETTLAAIAAAGLPLGIVSNAQFFTPPLFPALLGCSLEQLGFQPDLTFFSYTHRRAKPGTFLFERAAEALAEQGIGVGDTVYVGNDMLNDVQAAAEVGFRTVLFAGDRRSLRTRDADDRVTQRPDAVIRTLSSLPVCLFRSKN